MADDDSTKIAEAKAKAEAVETEKSEDEAEAEDETQADEEQEETKADESKEESKENDEEETEDDKGDEATFEKRFTQFKGDTIEDYKKSLEEGYANSSTEAQRLAAENRELKQKVERVDKLTADNPDIADKLTTEGEQPLDPTTQVLRQQVEEQWKEEYETFAKDHPEIADEKVSEELNQALAIVRDHVWAKEGKIIGMDRGLRMAWKLLGKDEETDATSQAAKSVAGQSRSSGAKKVKTSSPLNEAQRAVAEKMGIDPTKAAKHVQTNE